MKTSFGSTGYSLKEAPSPSDINWKNLGSTAMSMLCSRIATFFVSFLMLAVSFFCILGLKAIQKKMSDKMTADRSFNINSLSIRALSIGITAVIMVINAAISMGLQAITLYEKHKTNTTFFRSLMIKIAVVQSKYNTRLNS